MTRLGFTPAELDDTGLDWKLIVIAALIAFAVFHATNQPAPQASRKVKR